MGMSKDHAQAVADQKALDDYGVEFHDLPASTQDTLFKQACEKVQNDMTILQERMRHD